MDDDFLAAYHANYGVSSVEESSSLVRDASGFAVPPKPSKVITSHYIDSPWQFIMDIHIIVMATHGYVYTHYRNAL